MIFRHLLLSIVTIIASLCCTDAYFASQNQQWTSNGPYGGEVLSVAVDPVSSERIYAGTAYGGVFKSIEGGLKGVPITIGQIEYVTSIAIDPLEPQNVYAGNWQELYKSLDYGETWTKINDKAGSSITINPLNPDIIYVAGSDDRVYKTINGGKSWDAITTPLSLYGSITDIAIDPIDPDTVYVLMNGGAIYKTTDAGTTWSEPISVGMNTAALEIDPNSSSTLYTGGHIGMAEGQIAKSLDGGISWAPVYTINEGNSWITSLLIDPSSSNIIFAGTAKGILRSSNNGGTWSKVLILTEDLEYTNPVNTLCVDPLQTSTVYAGLHAGGVFKSVDSGFNWFKVELGYPYVTVLTKDPQDETLLYAGSHFEGIFRSLDGGESWLETELKEGWVTSIDVDPKRTNLIYITTLDGVYNSSDSGHTWERIENGLYGLGTLIYPYSIAVNPDSTDVLLLGTGGDEGAPLYKSTNGGESWNVLSITASITWITIDYKDPDVVYANYGYFSKSTDFGTSWTSLFNQCLDAITIDPTSSDVLYATVFGDGVMKSTDAGTTWVNLSEGLLDDTGYVRSIIIDPSNSDVIYAQTWQQGVFKTTNAGTTWVKLEPPLLCCNSLQLSSFHCDQTLVFFREGDYLLQAGTQAGVWNLTVPPGAKGDVNRNGQINILDVVRVINIILELPPEPTTYEIWAADFNEDEEVNILDVIGMVNEILSPIPSIHTTRDH
jgi:photosystem II stability/assembly factor-like uncharacterized protein